MGRLVCCFPLISNSVLSSIDPIVGRFYFQLFVTGLNGSSETWEKGEFYNSVQ